MDLDYIRRELADIDGLENKAAALRKDHLTRIILDELPPEKRYVAAKEMETLLLIRETVKALRP